MPLRTLCLLAVAVASPAVASGDLDELESLVNRRGKVIEALRLARPRACERLVALSHAVPAPAVLSRLAFSQAGQLEKPRVRNGEWVVDLSLAATTWRYRAEDEQKEVRTSFSTAPRPAPRSGDNAPAMDRSPFGPPGRLFAGSGRVLTGKECRKERVLEPRDGELEGHDLDEFAVAYAATKGPQVCAMLIDTQGHCHLLWRNVRFGPRLGKVTSIDAEAVTVTRYANANWDPMKRPYARSVALKVPAKNAPPAWFCPQK